MYPRGFPFEWANMCTENQHMAHGSRQLLTSSTAQGGGGSFQNRKPNGGWFAGFRQWFQVIQGRAVHPRLRARFCCLQKFKTRHDDVPDRVKTPKNFSVYCNTLLTSCQHQLHSKVSVSNFTHSSGSLL